MDSRIALYVDGRSDARRIARACLFINSYRRANGQLPLSLGGGTREEKLPSPQDHVKSVAAWQFQRKLGLTAEKHKYQCARVGRFMRSGNEQMSR